MDKGLPPLDNIFLKRRINPLTRAIKNAEKIKDPTRAYKAWLEIAEFVYAKPKGAVQTPLSHAQSSVNQKAAAKLLKSLENAAKGKSKEAQLDNGQKEGSEFNPESHAGDVAGSDQPGLGNGESEVQTEGTPDTGV